MGKGLGLCLCIAHLYLDRILSSLFFYVYEYECMNMCDLNVLCERFAHIYGYTHTHMNGDLVNRGALKGVFKCIVN